jgi:hypothetical protein
MPELHALRWHAFELHAAECPTCDAVRRLVARGAMPSVPMAKLVNGWWAQCCTRGRPLIRGWSDACVTRVAETRGKANQLTLEVTSV